MSMTFKWRHGYPSKIPASVAGKRLRHLEQRCRRALQPDDVVADAHDRRSPLHEAFEWDDDKASSEWRRQQARQMLGALITVVVNIRKPKEPPRPIRVYPNVRDREEIRAYHNVTDVMSDRVMRKNYLDQARREFQSWRERYANLRELSSIFEAGDAVFGYGAQRRAAGD